MLLGSLICLLCFLLSRYVGSENAGELQFCPFLQNTPEPSLLVYNRVPKAAGTTVGMMVTHNSQKGTKLLSMSHHTFGRSDNFSSSEIASIKESLSRNDRVFLFGHFHFENFSRFGIPSNKISYMQVVRRCKDRLHSFLGYYLNILRYDHRLRTLQKGVSQTAYSQNTILGTKLSVESCLTNLSCIKNSPYLGFITSPASSQIAFLGGGINDRKMSKAAAVKRVKQFSTPHSYAVVGTQELMQDTIDLLKCAYPSYFGPYDPTLKLMDRHNVGNNDKNMSHALNGYFSRMCARGRNADDYLHSIATLELQRKVMEMRSTPNCCRKLPK